MKELIKQILFSASDFLNREQIKKLEVVLKQKLYNVDSPKHI